MSTKNFVTLLSVLVILYVIVLQNKWQSVQLRELNDKTENCECKK